MKKKNKRKAHRKNRSRTAKKSRSVPRSKRYDLHTHTNYSLCGVSSPERLIAAAKASGLDGIAITDHNTIEGALEAKRINKDRNFEVIVGEEVMTDKGELLLYYLKEPVKPGKIFHVIDDARKQGAIIAIAHPYTTVRKGFKYPMGDIARHIDAVEVANGRNFFASERERAEDDAELYELALIGGSDGHVSVEIGSAYTEFSGELRSAIRNTRTRAYCPNNIKRAPFLLPCMFLSGVKKRIIKIGRKLFCSKC